MILIRLKCCFVLHFLTLISCVSWNVSTCAIIHCLPGTLARGLIKSTVAGILRPSTLIWKAHSWNDGLLCCTSTCTHTHTHFWRAFKLQVRMCTDHMQILHHLFSSWGLSFYGSWYPWKILESIPTQTPKAGYILQRLLPKALWVFSPRIFKQPVLATQMALPRQVNELLLWSCCQELGLSSRCRRSQTVVSI